MSDWFTLLKKYREKRPSKKFKYERWLTFDEAIIISELITANNVEHYYECGTANGYSACYASACKSLISVDTWDPADRHKLYDEPEFQDLKSKVTFHHCKYNDTINTVSANRIGKALFFIDGDHKIRPARNDIKNTMRCVRSGDIMVLHDVLGYDWLNDRMNEFLKTHTAEIRHTDHGMGIVYF